MGPREVGGLRKNLQTWLQNLLQKGGYAERRNGRPPRLLEIPRLEENHMLNGEDAVSRLEAARLGAAGLRSRWKDLVGEEPVKASVAFWDLMGGGVEALHFVETSWQSYVVEEAARVAEELKSMAVVFERRVKNLSHEEFKLRQEARQALQRLGSGSLPLVADALKQASDPETKVALKVLKRKLEATRGEVHLHADLVESRVTHLRRIWDCHLRGYRVTSSADGRNAIFSSAGSANDGFVPLSSHDFRVPRVDWRSEVGGAEWLQYEFDAPKSFTSAAVFWYDDLRPKLAGPPKSWRVQYRDRGGGWKEVQTKDAYELKLDTFNEVHFERVTTTALRLALESTKTHAPGVLEFRALPVE